MCCSTRPYGFFEGFLVIAGGTDLSDIGRAHATYIADQGAEDWEEA